MRPLPYWFLRLPANLICKQTFDSLKICYNFLEWYKNKYTNVFCANFCLTWFIYMDFCLYFLRIDFSFGFQDMVSKNFIKWIITTKYTLIIHPDLGPREITLDSAVFHMFVVYGHVFFTVPICFSRKWQKSVFWAYFREMLIFLSQYMRGCGNWTYGPHGHNSYTNKQRALRMQELIFRSFT